MNVLPSYISNILLVAAAAAVIILLIKIISAPIKKIFKLLFNTAVGIGLLLIINYVGKNFGISLEINPTRCALAAVFGIPGVILMILLELIV